MPSIAEVVPLLIKPLAQPVSQILEPFSHHAVNIIKNILIINLAPTTNSSPNGFNLNNCLWKDPSPYKNCLVCADGFFKKTDTSVWPNAG